jgi:hypothetical protein
MRRGSISINGDDSSLDPSLGSDQLVVCGVVNGVCDTGLASGLFRGPWEVSGVQTGSTEFDVFSASPDQVNALWSNLGVSDWSSELVLSLLVWDWTSGTGLVTLVIRVTREFVPEAQAQSCHINSSKGSQIPGRAGGRVSPTRTGRPGGSWVPYKVFSKF